MPSLAAQIGVCWVRSSAIVNLRRVCCELGEEWTVGMAMPHLTDMADMAQSGDVGSGCTTALTHQDEKENDEDGFAPMATTSEPTAKGENQRRLLSPSVWMLTKVVCYCFSFAPFAFGANCH